MHSRSGASRFWNSARWVGYALFCGAAVAGGAAVHLVNRSEVLRSIVHQEIFDQQAQEVFEQKGSINVLLLGCDEDRAYGGKTILKDKARSDMMLLVKIDFDNDRITGLSIPRDTVVRMAPYRQMRINAFHQVGGKDLSEEAVEYLTGVPVDRTVVIDYDAVAHMVDLVGGVPVHVDTRMYKRDVRGDLYIDFKPGDYVLDGEKAIGYVRWRGDSDFGRQERQRAFLVAFKDVVMGKPGLIPDVANSAIEVLDGEFSAKEMAALIRFSRGVDNANIKMATLPVIEGRGYDLKVDSRQMRRQLIELNFFDDQLTGRL